MSTLETPEFLAMVFYIHEKRQTLFDTQLKCPECQYVYPNEKITKHMCHFLDNIKCKGCNHDYPNKATYYKCKQYYEENEIDKKELNKILKERKLNDLDEEPHQMQCLCIRKIGKCQFCYL